MVFSKLIDHNDSGQQRSFEWTMCDYSQLLLRPQFSLLASEHI